MIRLPDMCAFRGQQPKIAALVVSYNRPDELRMVIDALFRQSQLPDSVIVVDNCGIVSVRSCLQDWGDRVTVIRTPENLGGAGGFGYGLNHVLQCNPDMDWIWLMDDDAVPEPDALLHLIRALPGLPGKVGALCGAVYENGVIAPWHRRLFDSWFGLEWPIPASRYVEKYIDITTGSFVGFMLKIDTAHDIGLPDAAFFISYDDTEYSLRMGRKGWQLGLVPGSIINHLRTSGARLGEGPFALKHYYNIRNRLVVQRRYCRFAVVAVANGICIALILWIMTRGWRSKKSLGLLFSAVMDGINGSI